jgi:hypothetical protein
MYAALTTWLMLHAHCKWQSSSCRKTMWQAVDVTLKPSLATQNTLQQHSRQHHKSDNSQYAVQVPLTQPCDACDCRHITMAGGKQAAQAGSSMAGRQLRTATTGTFSHPYL